jgi:adenylate cyclase
MNANLALLNSERKTNSLPPVGMRIGIATGEIIAGSLGSRKRLKYTTIGDTVNIAARLESYGRELVSGSGAGTCTILVDETTKTIVENDFEFECIGEVSLKGKSQVVGVYRLNS